jgi:hypothetical protein
VTITALGLVTALMVRTGEVAPFAVFTILLGLATLWLGYDREWTVLRWPAAAAADLYVLGLTMRATASEAREPPELAMLVQLSLLTAYVVMVAGRTLVRGRSVIPFEVVQIAAALVLGLGGAAWVAATAGTGAAPLGVVTLVFGAGCYAVAFAFVERRDGSRRNFYFYTTLAIVLTLVGSVLASGGAVATTLAWAALAVVATLGGRRFSRTCLLMHGATYVAAAAVASGALVAASLALFGPSAGTWRDLGVAVVAVVASAGGVCVLATPRAAPAAVLERVPRLVSLSLAAWCGAGIVVVTSAPLVARAGGTIDPGALATLRTAILAGAALGLAWVGRAFRVPEASWLVYPVLAAGGVKLLVDDLRFSPARTLFLALVLYGLALVVAPRLGRRSPMTDAPAA